MARAKVVTRDDVARYAQVSTAVVSYVVNGGPKAVRPETAARVHEAIRVLGYRPNAAARALKLRSQEILGMVLSSGNPPFVELANAVEDAAQARGFALILANSRSQSARQRDNLANLVARQVDGILLASVDSAPDLSVATTAGIPLVLLDAVDGPDQVAAVGPDKRAAARAAVRHLVVDHGHREVALVAGPPSEQIDEFEAGWREALAEHDARSGLILPAALSRTGGYGAGRTLTDSSRRPTAVFVSHDIQAVGVLRAIHEAGLQAPDDLAIVSYGGAAEAEYTWPPLSTMRQPIDAMAGDAVGTLLAIRSGEAEPAHRRYDTFLIARESCGCTTRPPH